MDEHTLLASEAGISWSVWHDAVAFVTGVRTGLHDSCDAFDYGSHMAAEIADCGAQGLAMLKPCWVFGCDFGRTVIEAGRTDRIRGTIKLLAR